MNLVGIYIEQVKGLPVTQDHYPSRVELYGAALVLIRFFINPCCNLYWIYKYRYGGTSVVITQELAESAIRSIGENGRYILIDSSCLPREQYLIIKSEVINYLSSRTAVKEMEKRYGILE